jgi:hypothetical protein
VDRHNSSNHLADPSGVCEEFPMLILRLIRDGGSGSRLSVSFALADHYCLWGKQFPLKSLWEL